MLSVSWTGFKLCLMSILRWCDCMSVLIQGFDCFLSAFYFLIRMLPVFNMGTDSYSRLILASFLYIYDRPCLIPVPHHKQHHFNILPILLLELLVFIYWHSCMEWNTHNWECFLFVILLQIRLLSASIHTKSCRLDVKVTKAKIKV